MNSASSQSGRKDELEVWVLLHEFSKYIYWCSLNYPQSRVSLNLATSLLAERPHDLTCIVRIRQMQLHLFTFFKWMKRFTCWHMGESKTVPSQGILTTTSAWVAVELAPLCSRVDFQEKCLHQNEGFPKPYYRVTQKKLFWLCFEFLTEISSWGHETQATGTTWNGSTAAFPCLTSQRLLL